MSPPSRPIGDVLAAGAVVIRKDAVLLVHRPRYGDWSFPKGKLDKGETSEQAAVREVEEETGLVCELGDEVAPARYIDGKGRRKEVRYWVMHVVEVHPWAPDDEVDRRLWVPVEDAASLLTYGHDRKLLDAFVATFDRRRPS